MPAPAEPQYDAVVVTFNTGTSEGLGHDARPDDGYGEAEAALSDAWYGDGLAWMPVVEDTQRFLAEVSPDIIAFQEIFYSEECADIPEDARAGFICEDWEAGDPTVAQLVLGGGYQVVCHFGKSDKCAAVKRSFGSFRGCDYGFCLEGLDGARVDGCGKGSRVGRGVIDLADGGSITLVSVHGSSGVTPEDRDCRAKQFEQVFVDLDGEPAANGERNLIMGDLNMDPVRMADGAGAQEWNEHVGDGKRFHHISDVSADGPGSYANLFNIDHVASDAFEGSCWVAGLTEGHPKVSDVLYFDHKPIVCGIDGL